jgi:hypothetical protein
MAHQGLLRHEEEKPYSLGCVAMRAYLLDRLDLSVNSTEITVKIQNCDTKLTHFSHPVKHAYKTK